MARNEAPWKVAKVLQKSSSNFKKLTENGTIWTGLTLHDLRITFTNRLKETIWAENRAVAKTIGDQSERMGAHYSRFAKNNVHHIGARKNRK